MPKPSPSNGGRPSYKDLYELVMRVEERLMNKIDALEESVSCMKGESRVWSGIIGGAVAAVVSWWVKQ